jgi:hypothetical protein
MTAKIPKIQVYLKKSAKSPGTGEAGKIACIGAFKTTATAPALYTSLDAAQTALGTDDTFDGCACLPYLFMSGATSVLAVNVSTESSGTWTKTVTADNLAASFAKIKGEDWDILFVAAPITDAFIALIDAYLDSTFTMKYPAGYVGALTGATDAANVTTAGAAGEHCYGLLTQQLTVNGTQLSVVNSAAYYCGLVAGMKVGNTMTMKTIPYVTAVSPELSFETAGSGKTLLEAGITTVKCADRGSKRYIVVNSEQPNGLDLYVNRVRDYVVKSFALHQFLGERNRETTLNEIKQEVDRVKMETVKSLDLLRDIEYTVEKRDSQTVDINIHRLLFDGLITEIDVYVTVVVE